MLRSRSRKSYGGTAPDGVRKQIAWLRGRSFQVIA
jgi:hypothetical protein